MIVTSCGDNAIRLESTALFLGLLWWIAKSVLILNWVQSLVFIIIPPSTQKFIVSILDPQKIMFNGKVVVFWCKKFLQSIFFFFEKWTVVQYLKI